MIAFDPNPHRPEPTPAPEPPTPGPWWAASVGPLDSMPHPRVSPRFGAADVLRALVDKAWEYCRPGRVS